MSDLRRLCSIAIRAANSQTCDGVDRCFDILGYLKKLSFSAKDIVRVSKEISPLANPSTCNNNTKLVKKTPSADLVAKVCPDLKKGNIKRSVTTLVKKQSAQPVKLYGNPRPLAREAVEIKKQKYVATVKKNSTEMLELFEIAEKSADKASAKGILLSTKETSICVDTLSLLIDFTISSSAPETNRIMKKLSYLTKHKDRKICNAATTLLQHWSQSINDQQLRELDSLKTQG
ncbi:hypothetical protein DY000_02001748 [Brassica cretica]|uniref:TFIIS N-terminal domain-containing protein n=1 Tax=Brassica cretica TaxID=69181 RepID=A0ABQ7BTV3_BRACR|nr:hypothetical protein DY000_02001748 [Brassica cretica]